MKAKKSKEETLPESAPAENAAEPTAEETLLADAALLASAEIHKDSKVPLDVRIAAELAMLNGETGSIGVHHGWRVYIGAKDKAPVGWIAAPVDHTTWQEFGIKYDNVLRAGLAYLGARGSKEDRGLAVFPDEGSRSNGLGAGFAPWAKAMKEKKPGVTDEKLREVWKAMQAAMADLGE